MTEDENLFQGLTILSLEQALSMSYCTYRMALKGARVIRAEALQGDPNRHVGFPLAGERGMNSHFLAVNAGKESISINLADERGQNLLLELVAKLPVDIFCTNQIPRNYSKLGIDYEKLAAVKPDLIWVGLSGFGPERSEPAYDPIIQALAGIMDETGEPDRDPLLAGVPLADLEAGNQAYAAIMEALYRKAVTGRGSRIDISMLQCTIALLSTKLTNVEFGEPVGRNGNRHRMFAPVNTYPTVDGYVIIAVGNDRQWAALVANPEFAELDCPEYSVNQGRIKDIVNLDLNLRKITRTLTMEVMLRMCRQSGIPVGQVANVKQILDDPALRKIMGRAKDPMSGREITLPPDPVGKPTGGRGVSFPPRLGEHSAEILALISRSEAEIKDLAEQGVIRLRNF